MFARLFAAVLAASLAAFAVPAQAFDDDVADRVLDQAVTGFIQPAMAQFATATQTLTGRLDRLCAAPSAAGLDAARAAFGETVTAFAAVNLVRIGPLTEDNRLERIFHFPDRKGIGRRQIEAILKARDESTTKTVALAGKSVAVQGLPALEMMLFSDTIDLAAGDPESHPCRYAEAIAGNLAQMAAELNRLWIDPSGASASLARPGTGASPWRDRKEAVTVLLGIAVHGAEALRETGIESFYRGNLERPKPKAAPFRFSGQTIRSLSAGFDALQAFWDEAGMALLLKPNEQSVSTSAMFNIKAIKRTLSTMAEPTETSLADPAYRKKLDFLLLTSKDLILRLSDDYGKAIGLSAGFSFSDGD